MRSTYSCFVFDSSLAVPPLCWNYITGGIKFSVVNHALMLSGKKSKAIPITGHESRC
jgi:hypothetical protein